MTNLLDPIEINANVRDITDEEVAFYQEHGWVKLDNLITRDLAAELLRVAQEIQEESKSLPETVRTLPWGAEYKTRRGKQWVASWQEGMFSTRKIRIEPFRSFTFGPQMGRNAAKLINRSRLTDSEVPVRYLEDALLCLFPAADGGMNAGPSFHQDNYQLDRVGGFTFWVALDEVKPEQGGLRYLTGSHREGPLGSARTDGPRNVLERYPKLTELYEMSPPFHYTPGDATAHEERMVHGADYNNQTNRPRWSYIPTYIPGDGVFTDREWANDPEIYGTDTPFPEDPFPVVYPVMVAVG